MFSQYFKAPKSSGGPGVIDIDNIKSRIEAITDLAPAKY